MIYNLLREKSLQVGNECTYKEMVKCIIVSGFAKHDGYQFGNHDHMNEKHMKVI